MSKLPKFPVPEVDDLHKASIDEVRQELITLREFAGNLFMWCKDVQSETGVMALEARVRELEYQNLRMALTKDVNIALEGLRKDFNGLDGAINGARANLRVLMEWKRELEQTLKEENHDTNSQE